MKDARKFYPVGMCVLALMCVMPLRAGADLIENDNWVMDASLIAEVASQGQSTGIVSPYEGESFYSFALSAVRDSVTDPPVTIGMYQEGTNGLNGHQLRLTGWVQTERRNGVGDVGEAVLSVFDAEHALLAQASSGILATENFEWQSFMVELAAVPDGAYWRVDLYGTVYDGYYVNTFYDGVRLVALPAPGAALLGLLGLGSSGGLLRWRRRANSAASARS
jgi:hypothetical protein